MFPVRSGGFGCTGYGFAEKGFRVTCSPKVHTVLGSLLWFLYLVPCKLIRSFGPQVGFVEDVPCRLNEILASAPFESPTYQLPSLRM